MSDYIAQSDRPFCFYICSIQHSDKIDINHYGDSGNTPLHAAIGRGDTPMVQWMLQVGANVNAINQECNQATPLHLAVMNGKNLKAV